MAADGVAAALEVRAAGTAAGMQAQPAIHSPCCSLAAAAAAAASTLACASVILLRAAAKMGSAEVQLAPRLRSEPAMYSLPVLPTSNAIQSGRARTTRLLCPADQGGPGITPPGMQAKKAARKRKAMEALAAAAAAGTPRKRVTLPGRSARPPAVPAGAEARGTPAAAAAATMEPSSGHASPGGCTQSEKPAAGARKQRQQAQQEGAQQRQQVVSSSSLEPDQQQQQQQRGSGSTAAGAAGKTSTGSKSRQTLLTPVKGRQAAPSNGKAAAATATAAAAPRSASKAGESPAKSGRQRSTGSAQDVPEVLRQHELEAVAPEDSGKQHLVLQHAGRPACVQAIYEGSALDRRPLRFGMAMAGTMRCQCLHVYQRPDKAAPAAPPARRGCWTESDAASRLHRLPWCALLPPVQPSSSTRRGSLRRCRAATEGSPRCTGEDVRFNAPSPQHLHAPAVPCMLHVCITVLHMPPLARSCCSPYRIQQPTHAERVVPAVLPMRTPSRRLAPASRASKPFCLCPEGMTACAAAMALSTESTARHSCACPAQPGRGRQRGLLQPARHSSCTSMSSRDAHEGWAGPCCHFALRVWAPRPLMLVQLLRRAGCSGPGRLPVPAALRRNRPNATCRRTSIGGMFSPAAPHLATLPLRPWLVLDLWPLLRSVPDALCFRVKADRRLRTWKRRATEGGDYVVEAVVSAGLAVALRACCAPQSRRQGGFGRFDTRTSTRPQGIRVFQCGVLFESPTGSRKKSDLS